MMTFSNVLIEQSKAWKEGYAARAAGKDVSTCPFRGALIEYWLHGWQNARWDEEGNAY